MPSIRKQAVIKSICYSILCLAAICFSASFFPALGISENAPRLTVAIIAALALFEGVQFASFFAVIFGCIEALVYGESTLLYVLFYVIFAILCVKLYESFFSRNFLAWALYTLGGIILHQIIELFSPVTDWGITAADVFLETTLPCVLLSVLFSLPVYPLVAKIAKKTN